MGWVCGGGMRACWYGLSCSVDIWEGEMNENEWISQSKISALLNLCV